MVLVFLFVVNLFSCAGLHLSEESFSSQQTIDSGYGSDIAGKIAFETVVRNSIEPFVDSQTIYEKIYFGPNSAVLEDTAKEILWKKILWLEENPGKVLVIEGHSDTSGKEVSNLIMGYRRAESARKYLIELGADQRKVIAVSYGEEHPADLGRSKESHAKNRRVSFSIR